MIHSTVISSNTVTSTAGASTIIVNNVTGVWPVGITNDTDAFTSGGIVFSGSNLTFGTSVDGVTQYIQATAGGAGIAIGDGASNVTDATVVFADSNGISFGIAGSTITAGHNAYSTSSQLTATFAVRSHTHGNPTLALLNLSGDTASVSNGWTISLTGVAEGFSNTSQFSSAFLTGYTESTHDFTKYAGILSTGVTGANATINSSEILLNITGGVGGAALQGSGTYSQNTGTIQFANSNDITFGLTSNQMTASFSQSTHDHPYVNTSVSSDFLTTAAESNHTHDAYINTSISSNFLTTAALSNHTHDQYVNTSISSQWLTTAANSDHTHSEYVNTSISSQWLTTAMASANTSLFVYTSASSLLQHTSATSAITSNALNTSVSGSFQLTSDNSLSLGTGYTTHTHDYQSTAAYLTTAAQSGHTHGSISIASTAGTDFTYSSASNGMSFSIPKWITTYAAGGGEIDISAGASSASLGSLVFSNSNNVSFGLNGSTITGSASFSQSVQDAVIALNGSSGTLSLNVGSSLSSSVNGSSITFGLISDWSSVIQSAGAYLTTAAESDHGHTQYLTTAMASDGGSIYQLTSDNSLSLGTGYTTHTHLYQSTGNYLTTAALSDHTHSNLYIALGNSTAYQTSVLSGTFQTTGAYLTTAAVSNHTHDYQSTGAYLTTAMASDAGSNFAGVNSSTQSTAGSALAITYNTSGLSLGIPAWITTGGAGGGIAISASGSSETDGTVIFSASNGITFGLSDYTMTASVANNAGSLGFNDSNGVTFGIASTTSNSSTVVTASIAAYIGTNTTITTTSGTDLKVTAGTAGLNIAHPSWLTTYTPGGDGVAWSLSTVSGTDLLLSTATDTNTLYYPAWITTYVAGGGVADWSVSSITGSDILISTATNTITLYQPDYLTGYTESTHAFTQYVGLLSTDITGGSATINSSQLYINIPSNAGSLGFSDSNGVTFGVASTTSNSSTVVTASIAAYAGTSLSTVSTTGSVLLGGINTAGISLSVPAWLTTGGAGGGVAIIASDATYTSGSVSFRGTNITIGTSAGGQYVDLSVAAIPDRIGTNTSISSAYAGSQMAMAVNTSGITLSVPAWLTTAAGTAVYTDMEWHNFTGNSTHAAPGQNTIWYQPFELRNPVSASSLQIGMTFNGTSTSAATAQFGMTHDFMLLARHSTDSTRFDSIWSTQGQLTVWNSGTSSGSYSSDVGSASSAGSRLLGSYIYGQRIISYAIGSELSTGFYMFAYRQSTSTEAYSALMRSYNPVFVAPLPLAKNFIGAQTNISIGHFLDGRYSVTSAAFPASIGITELLKSNDLRIFFKIGATS